MSHDYVHTHDHETHEVMSLAISTLAAKISACMMFDVSVSLSYLLLYSLVFRLNLDGLWTHRAV